MTANMHKLNFAFKDFSEDNLWLCLNFAFEQLFKHKNELYSSMTYNFLWCVAMGYKLTVLSEVGLDL